MLEASIGCHVPAETTKRPSYKRDSSALKEYGMLLNSGGQIKYGICTELRRELMAMGG